MTFALEGRTREYKVLTLSGPDKARSWAAGIQASEHPAERVLAVSVDHVENYTDEERMKSICDRMEW